ncbi:MAG TPA: bifunctional glycosyltransferase family 2/GtrA family protein [Candidatus Paceibacterota bacterium]|nr:bifunctional glycosyltransferase family 2/GtrA family protein [Candidatus Paceibacterota bacterium]
MKKAVIIPAYEPGEHFAPFIRELAEGPYERIVIVDDGSSAPAQRFFDEVRGTPRTVVLAHEVNRGKGAALKTAFGYIRASEPDIEHVVTADADGQHAPEDILRTAQKLETEPGALVLGTRTFEGEVPWRSRFGNTLTRGLFKALFGIAISDTQTGLRALPASALSHFIAIPYNRYEFESEMLLVASRATMPIREVPIRTIYEDGNASSHFNPLIDSFKIYFVLLRYTLASLASALIDFVVFLLIYPLVANVLVAIYTARAVSLFANYGLNSNAVFHDRASIWRTFPKYLLLVIISGFVAAGLIIAGHLYIGLPIALAKILAESMLYVVNFFVQKKFIFTAHRS